MTVDLLDPVYTDPDKFLNGQKHAQIHLSTTVIIFCSFCICCPSVTGHNEINISKIPLVFSVYKNRVIQNYVYGKCQFVPRDQGFP